MGLAERAKRSEMNLKEIKNKLADYDVLTLLEILDLSVEDVLYHLSDVIEEKQDELREYLDPEDTF